jgi:hypothetical protein
MPTQNEPKTTDMTVYKAAIIPLDLIVQLITWALKLLFKIP